MKPLRVFVADEEHSDREHLQAILRAIPGIELVGEARDGEEAERVIEALDPDLAVLNTDMPVKSGLQLAAALRNEGGPEVVFVSADETLAVDAYSVEAIDYILKPAQLGRMVVAIDRARRIRDLRRLAQGIAPQSCDNSIGLWVATRSGTALVDFDKILWVEAQREYVVLHTEERDYIARRSMAALEDALSSRGIVRVHRSRFVKLSKVVETRRGRRAVQAVVLRDGTTIPVGAKYAFDLAARLAGA